MRRFFSLVLFALAAHSSGAQSIYDGELRLAPQFMQYRINAPSNETISELAIPVFVRVPFGSAFTFDVGTSYARARVTSPDGVSEVSGLTDTQLRGNLTLGTDFIVLTGGVNLPTGRSSVTADELTAAGRIGSDFLAFPISNMGTGFGFTGGIAVARPLGEWNLGFGGAVRRSSSYDPFKIPGQTLRFQPGDEYRARVGLDHPFGYGRVTLGITYSAFTDDNAGGFVYNTGNRLIAQAAASNTYSGTDVTLAAYNVFRGNGNYASGDPAGHENILNGYVGLGLHMLGTVVEPSLEGRQWLQDVPTASSGGVASASRSQSSYLGTVGLRTRIELAGLSFYPSAGYTIGRLATVGASNSVATADMTGYRVQLAVRLGQ
jgi:hypothetical protein